MKKIIEYIGNTLAFCYENYENQPIEIKIIWFCIPLFICLILLFLFAIITIKIRNYISNKLTNKYKPLMQKTIMECLATNGNDKINYCNKELLNTNFKKKLFISILLELNSSLSGELKKKVQELYIQLSLFNYSFSKIKNTSWNIKIEGIRELTQLEYKTNVDNAIIPYMNHSNEILRGEIQLAMVKLYGVNGLFYLNNLKYQLSEWQQIEIIDALKSHINFKMPDLKIWYESNNNSVVEIALKITQKYQLINYCNSIIKLLHHDNYYIRMKSRFLIRHFKLIEATNRLCEMFKEPYELEELQDIVDTLEQLGVEYNYFDLDNNDLKNIYILKEMQQLMLKI
ncbi:hypothetical protein [Flavobacterium sp.]|uniref:hypothetical protein n=1 Tax=Flavobacterium sp. TaxID=239 RepID=UPI0026243C98|nr:hypothetical protein [Flavobacterium sp.]